MQFSENIRFGYFIIAALAIGLYANTMFHEFVLDDDVVIGSNSYVQKGIAGLPDIFTHDSFAGFQKVEKGETVLEGGRYRPLSMVLFAFVYTIFGADPFPFHLLSILVFALATMVVYHWLRLLFKSTINGEWIAFFTTLLFVAHPLHTEVVANVKSMDESLALLFGAAAMYSMLRAFDTSSKLKMTLAFIFMVAACLSKENAITFLLVAPFSLLLFREIKFSRAITQSLPVIAGGLLFILIRIAVIGLQPPGLMMQDPLNNPFLEWTDNAWIACSPMTKAATILYTFGLSVKLMVFPYPLTHDYFPYHIELQSFSSPWVLVSLLLFVAMVGYSIWGILQKKKGAFGIFFFLVTTSLTANVFFPVGVFMAERFLFLPSLGFLMAIVVWGYELTGQEKSKLLIPVFAIIIAIFSVLTVMRNPAWKNNETLFRTDIIHSPNSAKGQNELGTNLLDTALKMEESVQRKELLNEAYPHFQRALELHPTYYDAYLASGACAYYLGRYDQSVNAYFTASKLYPEDAKSRTGLWYALQAYGRDQWTRQDTIVPFTALTEAWNIQQDTAIAADLARYYQLIGKSEKAKEWRDKTVLSFK